MEHGEDLVQLSRGSGSSEHLGWGQGVKSGHAPQSSLAIDFSLSNKEINEILGKIKLFLPSNVWICHMVYPQAECLDPPLWRISGYRARQDMKEQEPASNSD